MNSTLWQSEKLKHIRGNMPTTNAEIRTIVRSQKLRKKVTLPYKHPEQIIKISFGKVSIFSGAHRMCVYNLVFAVLR